MKFIRLLFPALAIALCMHAPALAQKKTTAAPPVKITSVEGITEYDLSNGLKVLIFPDPSKPTITVNVTYLVGSRMEGYGETGMAHLLEHMQFKGSKNHPKVDDEFTAHGTDNNATTYYDRTNYFETFAATDTNLDWALRMESDRMVNSFIAEKDLKSEFSVVRNEFESGENSPSNILMERVISTAYLWHNYGKSTIGSKEDIERVSVPHLQAFYKKYYQPDNAVLLVAGKIDEAKTLALINKYFGAIPKPTRVIEPTYTIEPAQDGERSVELRRVGDVQSIGLLYHIVAGSDPDYEAFDVLNDILTNQPNGRLYQSMVKSGLATSVWSYDPGLKDASFLYINADVLKEKSLDDAKDALMSTIKELTTKPITEEEVTKSKNKILSDFETQYRATDRIGLWLSEFIPQGDWRMAFIYRDNVKKVTAADVNRIVAKYLIKSNRTVGVFIPTANPKRTTVPEPPNVANIVKDYKGQAALAQAEAFEATPDNIEKRTERGKIPGGAKYALLSKTTRGSSVNVAITMRIGDVSSLMNKTTISSLTASMLMRGTTTKTRAQINEMLDQLSTKMYIYGGGQTIGISIESTKPNLPKVLDLLDDVLHNPSFSADELKTLKEENISYLEQGRSEPQSIAFREYNRIMNPRPKGHPEYTMTVDEEEAATKAVTEEDIKKFYKDFYATSNATIAFVGDFDVAAVKEKMNKTFANWSAPMAYTRIPNQYDEVTACNKEYKTPDKKNAMFVCGMNLKLRDDNVDFPALVMGDFMFGGGFLNSRLATRLRQKDGLSYGVGSYLQADPINESGSFFSYAIYNPDNKTKLETAWNEELAKMLKDGFTDDEVKQAKSGIIQYRQNSRADDGQLADKLSRYLFLDRTFTWDRSMDDKYLKVSVADINNAMKKFLDPTKVTYVKAGDFK